tara:strand:+ start:2230 stop:2436 length:207 start_codon:yes stop_codon:yes gene_type:complete
MLLFVSPLSMVPEKKRKVAEKEKKVVWSSFNNISKNEILFVLLKLIDQSGCYSENDTTGIWEKPRRRH